MLSSGQVPDPLLCMPGSFWVIRASSKNIKKPIQSMCSNLFSIRVWYLLIQIKELEKNIRELEGFQNVYNCSVEEKYGYFLCSFPSLHWILGVFSFYYQQHGKNWLHPLIQMCFIKAVRAL